MAETISFVVPAIPVGQPKPEAVRFGDKSRVHPKTTIKNADGTRKPHPIMAFRATVRMTAAAAYAAAPLSGPVRVDCLFVFPRHASKFWKSKPMPRYWHTAKPDRDNIDKAVLDSLKGIILSDDAIVCDGQITKLHASGDEQPHCVVTITTLD